MEPNSFNPNDWDKLHFTQSEAFAEQVRLIYQDAINDATQLAVGLGVDTNKPFSFDRYPAARARLTEILTRLADRMQTMIQAGQTAAWTLANNKNEAFVESIRPVLPALNPERVNSRNLDALTAFQNRKVGGLGLSDRIFKYGGQFKREIELGLDIGIGEGRSANQISQSLRSYMEQPDKLFRRVRDKRGNLALSKAAAAYHPGQGVYRSSFKNAQRLARTEINMAYREAEHLRLQGLPFVVGYEVRRSNRVFTCDVCGPLAGKYPKTFRFVGWHPNCRCFVIPILLTPEEFERMNEQLLLGEEIGDVASVNRVEQPPAGWFDWLERNQSQLSRAKNKPYFVLDNPLFMQPLVAPPAVEQQLMQNEGIKRAISELSTRKGLPRSLTTLEGATINYYTNQHYYEINRYLRKPVEGSEFKTITEVMSRALEKLPDAKKKVFRSDSLPDSMLSELQRAAASGKPVTYEGFTSTSLKPGFVVDGMNTQIVIKSKSGKDISKLSHTPTEKEILFDKGTRFKVLNYKTLGDVAFIELEQL